MRVRKDSSHESYLESLEPVEFANGVVDYMTLTFMHDDVLDVKQAKLYVRARKSVMKVDLVVAVRTVLAHIFTLKRAEAGISLIRFKMELVPTVLQIR